MEFFGKIINFLDYRIETPTPYGAFHIVSLILLILVCFLIVLNSSKISEKIYRKVILFSWITIVILELYKQFNFSFSYEENKVVFDYQWYAFPYQFCSTPLYVLPFIAFAKNDKIYYPCVAYIMTYSLFAGLGVMAYPGTIYVETLLINVQTTIHHGLQVVLGVLTACVYKDKLRDLSFFVKGIWVFLIALFIALTLNLIAPLITKETFNMFFISPYFECTLPILSSIKPNVWYPLFLLIYTLGFTLVSLAVYEILSLLLKRKKS